MNILEWVHLYWEDFLDLIYPRGFSCIVCKGNLEKEAKYEICTSCYSKITFMEKEHWIEGTRVFSVAAYKGVIRQFIFRYKYSHQTYLARIMAQMMAELILEEGLKMDAIVAVPLHIKRQKQRGFNQSSLLTKYMSRQLKIPDVKNNLIRVKDTAAMHTLSRGERKKNLLGAFQVKEPHAFEDQHLLLVDDIFTTGTTVNACSRVLIEAGAREVTAITFARGVAEEDYIKTL